MVAIDEIRRCVRDGSLAHAYILEGDVGEQRNNVIREMVQTILCEEPITLERPCGVCSACRRIRAGNHEDVVMMQMSGKTSYLTKDSEAFMARLSMNAYGEHLVGIIPNADMMSEVVQNKLLKTLEEPAPGTVIILAVSNRESLLDTVRSRCVLLRMTEQNTELDRNEAVALWDSEHFFEYRKGLDKNFKSQEEALHFLDAIEVEAHLRQEIEGVIRIEETRRDIMQGMGWKPALKKLYLELHD